MEKERLDVLLTERGIVESRALAQRLVMAGQVRVDGQVVLKPATRFNIKVEISLDQGPKFVSRGGEKLEGALQAFGVLDLKGKTCADVGSSTGGFTDCLLQFGADKVYAIDVGYGLLHWKLRNDPRVISMEKINARNIQKLDEAVHLVTIDASFISLKNILPVISNWFGSDGGQVIALIKPQFEAGRKETAKGEGVIRDPEIHKRVIRDILIFAGENGYRVMDLAISPLTGPKGNHEFLVRLEYPGIISEDFSEWLEESILRIFSKPAIEET